MVEVLASISKNEFDDGQMDPITQTQYKMNPFLWDRPCQERWMKKMEKVRKTKRKTIEKQGIIPEEIRKCYMLQEKSNLNQINQPKLLINLSKRTCVCAKWIYYLGFKTLLQHL